MAAAKRLSGFEQAQSKPGPSTKPKTSSPSHRSTGDFRTITIIQAIPPGQISPRTQVSKHFGTIDGLAKYTFAARGKLRSGDGIGTIGPPGLPNLGGAAMLNAAKGRRWREVPLAEIKNRDELEAWLRKQPCEVSIAFAARAALRVLPVVQLEKRETYIRDLVLPVFRATVVSWATAKYPAREKELATACRAADVHGWETARTGHTAYAVTRNSLIALGKVLIRANSIMATVAGGIVLSSADPGLQMTEHVIQFMLEDAQIVASFAEPFPELRNWFGFLIDHIDREKLRSGH